MLYGTSNSAQALTLTNLVGQDPSTNFPLSSQVFENQKANAAQATLDAELRSHVLLHILIESVKPVIDLLGVQFVNE